jgi:hypothetical protein
MNNFFRTLIAGYGAKKLGGGCFSTILVFIVIYWALGTCNRGTQTTTPQRTELNTPAHKVPQIAAVKY